MSIPAKSTLPKGRRASLKQSLPIFSENELSLARELWRRECKTSLTAFCIEALAPFKQVPAAHHKLLIQELEAVTKAIAAGEQYRLLVEMPPGSAKSTYGSVLFPAWFLAQQPRLSLIGASHTADLAEMFSRRVMNVVRDHQDLLGYSLITEGVGAWSTSNGGEYKAAGIGGPITGRRADLAVIDDPVKSRAVAESEVEREKVWNWYIADLRTRLKPAAAIVLIMTRWHQDDLGGRLLLQQPDLWRVLKLPAFAGDNDPIGREPGEPLWSDDEYGYGNSLHQIRSEAEKNGAMRDWSALYQQEPRSLEGALFKIEKVEVLEAAPACAKVVRAWDLAATSQVGTRDPDWTAGVKLGKTPEGKFVVLDVVRLRGGPDEVDAAIVNTAAQDGTNVEIGLPQDPGQAGKSQILYLTRQLAGFRVKSSPETGSKDTRSAPVASQCNVGNLAVVKAPWNRAFLEEVAGFPSMKHDDSVDALSRAFAMLTSVGIEGWLQYMSQFGPKAA